MSKVPDTGLELLREMCTVHDQALAKFCVKWNCSYSFHATQTFAAA